MILTVLFCLLCVAAIFQPNLQRLFAAGVFMAAIFTHETFFANFDGLLYYLTAALLDSVVIILISGVRPLSKMVLTVQKICFGSILINFFGWIIWQAYLPPNIYDGAFVLLYSWALLTFLTKDRVNDGPLGNYTVDRWMSRLRGTSHSRSVRRHKHEGGA